MKGLKFAWHRAVVRDPDLPALAKLVAFVMWDHSNESGRSIYPGVKLLAEECGVSERTARTQLRTLRDRGWLLRIKRRPPGTKLSDEYELTVPRRAAERSEEVSRFFKVPAPPAGT